MKKVFAALVWALVLVTVCGCGGASDGGETATEPVAQTHMQTQPVQEITVQTEPVQEPVIPEETEPESWTDAPEELVFSDIAPFGNVAGRIVSAKGNEHFPGWEEDTVSKQIFTSGEWIMNSIFYSFDRPVYVVDGYVEKIQALYDAVETVTGLSFRQRPSKMDMEEQLVWITLKNSFMEGAHEDADIGSDGAFPEDRNVNISQGSALLGHTDDLIAGLASVLQVDQAYNRLNSIYSAGFSSYTAYKVQKYLEENDPQLAMVSRDSTESWMNYYINGGLDALRQNPMDHWIRNSDSLWEIIIGNGTTSVGFFYMMYLDEVYGDYCLWIPAYAENYRCVYLNQTQYIDDQIQVMRDVYGEEVFEGFYPWLEEKLQTNNAYDRDYSWRKNYVYYPCFAGYGYEPGMFDGKYEDMCVSLAEYRNYMTEFKGYSLDTLTLVNDRAVTVALYDQNGRFMTATVGDRTEQGEYRIDLENVYYVQFAGTGTVRAELRLQ